MTPRASTEIKNTIDKIRCMIQVLATASISRLITPGFEWTILFILRCSSSPSCMNEYEVGILSQIIILCARLNKPVMEVMFKALKQY